MFCICAFNPIYFITRIDKDVEQKKESYRICIKGFTFLYCYKSAIVALLGYKGYIIYRKHNYVNYIHVLPILSYTLTDQGKMKICKWMLVWI